MASVDLPILVVDDAKFSSAVIARTLKAAGYKDVRIANSAGQALEMIEERAASVLIADWLMPEMDGLELAGKIRQIDENTGTFTYIILLTAKEGTKVLVNAFDKGVDDFINKSAMNQQLLPRIYAAGRLANMQNRLMQENKLLLDANRKLKKYSTIDPLTGLGNRQYAEKRFGELIKHCDSRGGVPCLALISVESFDDIRKRHSKREVSQLIVGISRRLRQLVRPIDVVIRHSNQQFILITQRDDIGQVDSRTFKRVYDGINLKAYKTSGGFISITSRISAIGIEPKISGNPNVSEVIEEASSGLSATTELEPIFVNYWHTIMNQKEQQQN